MNVGGARVCLARVLWICVAVAPIRLALAGAGLGAAFAAGASRQAGMLAFALGLGGGALFVLADPRRRWGGRGEIEPVERPAGAEEEDWWRTALRALYPSTLGLAVLAAISLAFSAVLVGVLAGVIGGLGVAGLVAGVEVVAKERMLGGRVLAQRGSGTLFLDRGQ
jgi:hypothetical protein